MASRHAPKPLLLPDAPLEAFVARPMGTPCSASVVGPDKLSSLFPPPSCMSDRFPLPHLQIVPAPPPQIPDAH
jgi:hypothetical protein